MHQPDLLRLQRIEVDQLFGIYDHRIHLNLKDRVTLLHGPNGVGKTSVLRMVDALLRNDFACFRRIPFARFLLRFHDGSTLELHGSANSIDKDGSATLTLTNPDGTSHSDHIDLRPSAAESVADRIPYLQPHHSLPGNWIDVRDGEVLSDSEVLSRFGNNLGAKWTELAGLLTLSSPVLGADRAPGEKPPWLNAFLEKTNAFLIEAQRLVRTKSPTRPRIAPFPGPSTFVSSVLECSRDFYDRLGRTMAAYGRQAQTLDQTFPQRLISATRRLPEDELQERMADLDRKTEGLKTIGILDETPAHPVDTARLRDMDATVARAMTLYVEDTEHKLGALDDLARRTRLLLGNVNGKFRNKQIHLDRTDGLVAESGGSRLQLNSLSSGEQHELVLHYDLLFRVQPNTVVLIDEPELSLHVEWQKRFLPDLKQIVELSGFDAVVATHSPFIVGDDDDLMVGLGDSV